MRSAVLSKAPSMYAMRSSFLTRQIPRSPNCGGAQFAAADQRIHQRALDSQDLPHLLQRQHLRRTPCRLPGPGASRSYQHPSAATFDPSSFLISFLKIFIDCPTLLARPQKGVDMNEM